MRILIPLSVSVELEPGGSYLTCSTVHTKEVKALTSM